jgi:hypothetical protein
VNSWVRDIPPFPQSGELNLMFLAVIHAIHKAGVSLYSLPRSAFCFHSLKDGVDVSEVLTVSDDGQPYHNPVREGLATA